MRKGYFLEFNNSAAHREKVPGMLFGLLVNRTLATFFELDQNAFLRFLTKLKIVPATLEDQLPAFQCTEYTTQMARELGKLVLAVPFIGEAGPKKSPLGSPMVLENYIRSWGGATGAYALQLADKGLRSVGLAPEKNVPTARLSEIPFIKAFTVAYPAYSAQSIQDFNEFYERNSRVINTVKSLGKQGDFENAEEVMLAEEHRDKFLSLEGIHQAIKTQNAVIMNVYRNPEMKPEEKRQLIDGIYFGMIEAAKSGVTLVREMEKELKEAR